MSFEDNVTLLTSNAAGRNLAWRHGNGAPSTFYNQGTPSAISICFNDFPSNNKMYRSFSVEGTNNIADDSTPLFSVNNSTTANQIRNSEVSVLNERGGIMYGSVGGSNDNNAKNVSALGTILDIEYNDTAEDILAAYDEGQTSYTITGIVYVDWFFGAQTNITQDTSLFLIAPNVASQLGSPIGGYSLENQDVNYNAINFVWSAQEVNDVIYGFNYINFEYTLNFDGFADLAPETIPVIVNTTLAPVAFDIVGSTLYSVTDTETNGGKPQGQYATLNMILGQGQAFEVYAFNAYYEANTLDHSK